MDFTGHYVIPAPPERVWDAIQDPAVLKACIPGCESIEKTGDTEFLAKATLKIGPVRASFKGKVTLTEMEPPTRCVLKGDGQGGVAGFAHGAAEVVLTPEGEGTVLSYTAKASVGGKLAQIGQRLVDGAAKQIADDFFARFSTEVAPPDPQDGDQASVDAYTRGTPGVSGAEAAGLEDAAGEAPPPHFTPRRGGIGAQIWVVGLLAIIVILLILFGVALY